MNTDPVKQDRLTLELLDAVDRRSDINQRRLANQLGVALGLTNSYLKRCVRKGYIKISEAPSNRYLYYLTPKGFSEKARLTAEFLSVSFNFYRKAGESCLAVYADCLRHGHDRVVLAGMSDLTEIAYLKSLETGISVLAVVAPGSARRMFFDIAVVDEMPAVDSWDRVMVTDLGRPQECFDELTGKFGPERVSVPGILRVSGQAQGGTELAESKG